MTSRSKSITAKSVRAPDPLVSFTPVTTEFVTHGYQRWSSTAHSVWTSVGGIHRIFDARPSCQQEFAVMRVTTLQTPFLRVILVLLIALFAGASGPARADNPYAVAGISDPA